MATAPKRLTKRGQDVRCFDRRVLDTSGKPRLVGGPHPFEKTTDILLSNGLLRFWVGNRGGPAFLNVEAFVASEWRAVGTLVVSESGNPLLSARLSRLTNDVGTVTLDVRDLGPVFVSLHRGERGVRIKHGDGIAPSVTASRSARWSGTPPVRELKNVFLDDAALFDGGLENTWGRSRLWWPQDVFVDAWTIGCTWQPLQDSDAALGPIQEWGDDAWGDGEWGGTGWAGDAHIMSIEDSSGEVGTVRYDFSTEKIVFTLGAQSISSPVISFAADDVVRVMGRFSTTEGMSLSVKIASGAITHTDDAAATDPGTLDAKYATLGIGPVDAADPDDPVPGGVYDQGTVVEGFLTDAEVEDLCAQTSRTASLPTPEARLVWFAPFDVTPAPTGSSSGGRVSGATDEWGLTRVVVALKSSSSAGLGLSRGDDVYEVGAYLTTGTTQDAPVDVHAQFAANSEQELAIR